MSIGENIRRIRKENHITQKELGEKLGGISQQQIGQWENDSKTPKIETIQKIAKALNVELWEIVELDQMDLETRIQQIKKMVAQLTPEGLKEFDRLATEALNREQESINKDQDEAAKKAPRAFIIENGKRVEADSPIKFTTSSRSHAQTEAYELFHSLLSEDWIMSQEQETIAVQLKEMLGAYNRLSDAGRKEAVKRVDELTEIPRYTKPDAPQS